MVALAGLIFGVPTLIAAVAVGIIDQRGTNPDVIPYVVAVTTTLAIMTFFAILRSAKVRRCRRFQNREVLTDDQWYDRYYGQTEFPKQTILSILSAFAAELGRRVRPTQLRPDDRIEYFALTFWGVPTDDSFETVECELATVFGDEFQVDPSWSTLGDVIVTTCQQPPDSSVD